VEPKQQRFLDAEPPAGEAEFLDTERPKVPHRSDRWMWLAGFTVGGTDQRDPNTAFTAMRERATMENLVVGMSQDDQERCRADASHDCCLWNIRQ
jgi:hypothetical protein